MSAVLHRKAKVDIQPSLKHQGRYDLIINDKVSHELSTRDQIHRAITATDVDNVIENLQGGYFLEQDGRIKEYRDNSYNGFVQSDEFVERFSNIKNLSSITEQGLSIAKYGLGGDFKLTTGFDWSVFSPTLDSTVGLERLICSNGMVVKEKLLQKKVPIINLFERHLQIASDQVMHYANMHLQDKIARMENEVASVREVNLVANHVNYRRQDSTHDSRFSNFAELLESGRLNEYYSKQALENAAIAETLPSHLDRYTLFNLVTEMRSHTTETDRSTGRALDVLASNLMLKESTVSHGGGKVPQRLFTSPEKAFIGV